MLQLAKYCWIGGALPFILLGTIHLVYTFFTSKFSSRNEVADEIMKTSYPILTKETTMWKAWIGFNASHSIGAMYFGIINLIVAIQYPELITNAVFIVLAVIVALFYLWLGKKYWFSTPFRGILISCCCFFAATLFVLFH